jgi:hypothetical protein
MEASALVRERAQVATAPARPIEQGHRFDWLVAMLILGSIVGTYVAFGAGIYYLVAALL